MKTNELLSGNLVEVRTKNNTQFGRGKVERVDQSWLKHAELKNAFPLQLNDNWLIYFGFRSTYAAHTFQKAFHEFSEHYMYITLSPEGNILTLGDRFTGKEHLMVFTNRPVEYVHQLQNLWRFLIGDELPIEINPNLYSLYLAR